MVNVGIEKIQVDGDFFESLIVYNFKSDFF